MWTMVRKQLGQASRGKKSSTRPAVRPLVVGIVVLQLAVPGMTLFQEPPARLGWQMYSGIGELPKINVKTVDGAFREVPFGDIGATRRGELSWSKYLPAHICEEFSDAASVDLIYTDAKQSFECES